MKLTLGLIQQINDLEQARSEEEDTSEQFIDLDGEVSA